MDKVKPIRFKENGPILVVCKDMKTKMNILKAAKHLGDNGYGGVYINVDRMQRQAAEDKKLRTEAKERNAKLPMGSEYFKYDIQTNTNGTKLRWFWGVRGWELRKIYKPDQ